MIKEMLALPPVAAMTADVQGIGYALADLVSLYQGQEVPCRSDNRLWLDLEALRGNEMLPPTPVSGKHIHSLQSQCFCGQVCKHYTLYHEVHTACL